jgi:chorismate synthase
MPWPEEQQAKPNRPTQPRNPDGGLHRSRRGGRRRNLRQTAKAVATEQIASPVLEKKEAQTTESAATAISKAVDEVRQIVESLEQALQQMEEVLRLVEVVERQKITDEHEIESLRHALRRIQQPRSRQPERPQPIS